MDTTRMTDRSRHVLKIAEAQAARLGAQAIEPEHILLALAIERNGVAGNILYYMGASTESIEDAILRSSTGASIITLPLQWSDESEHVVLRAQTEVKLLNHNYQGTEHLILGVVSTTNGRIPEILSDLGISPSSLRQEVYALLGHQLPAP